MSNICKIIGHKSPYYFIKCMLGNSFFYEKSYCRRCHKNIGKYETLHQKMWSAFGECETWVPIDNKPVDLFSSCNNPRWYLPLVYSPDEFNGEEYRTKLHGILKGSNKGHLLKTMFSSYVRDDENWKVNLPYTNLDFNFMLYDLSRETKRDKIPLGLGFRKFDKMKKVISQVTTLS